MNPRYLLAAALLLSLAAGCQSQREAYMVDIFNEQNLILEDKIYALNDRIDELESRLAARRGGGLQRSTDELETEDTTDDDAGSSMGSGSDSDALEEEDADLTPPEVEPGTPSDPEDLPGPDARRHPSHTRNVGYVPEDDDVSEIAISEVRPANFDNQPGDDGVLLVLEPKNELGETVLLPAKIEIKVGDPAISKHIGAWEFSPDVVAECFQDTDQLQAIVLDIPWTQIPEHHRLDLFVQYTRPDGAKVQNRTRFNIQLHENVASVWSARSPSAPTRQTLAESPASIVEQTEDGPPAEVYQ